ncbi:phage terminase large subunit [Fibrella sp. ES10-3-2-2]|nr:hypothetical protein A6C57_01010 [Fibrella sp. ES10-3-2-2]
MNNLLTIPVKETYTRLFKAGRFGFIAEHPVSGLINSKQQQALECLTDNFTTELMYGGAAGGAKSWTGCTWLLFMALLYPETRYFIGRESLKDIRDSTLITFYKVAKRYGLRANKDYRYQGQDNYIYFPNGSRIDMLELAFLPSDPMYERLGSKEYTAGFLEECGQIHFNAFDVLKTRIGRQLNDKYGIKAKLFLTCNPKKNWIYSYFVRPDKDKKLEPNQRFIKALVTDNPHRESDYEERLRSITDKVQRARLLEGNFEYEDDPSALIQYDKLLDLWSNAHVPGGQKYITCDAARFGADTAKIYVWDGWRLVKTYTYPSSSMPMLAGEIDRIMTFYGVPASNVVIDEDGIGGGCIDILREIKGKRVKGFLNGSSPMDELLPDGMEKPNYANLKAQCAYRAANRINEAGAFIAPDAFTEGDKLLFIQEMEQIKQKGMDNDKKKEILSKAEVKNAIGRSPDNSDTFIFREYFELIPKPVKPKARAYRPSPPKSKF